MSKEQEYIKGVVTDKGEPAFDIPINPEFNAVIRAFKETDPAHADLFNKAVQALIDNIYAVKNTVDTHIVISDTEPDTPCKVWLMPMGGAGFDGIIGAAHSTLNVTGAYMSAEAPEDLKSIWYKPIEV